MFCHCGCFARIILQLCVSSIALSSCSLSDPGNVDFALELTVVLRTQPFFIRLQPVASGCKRFALNLSEFWVAIRLCFLTKNVYFPWHKNASFDLKTKAKPPMHCSSGAACMLHKFVRATDRGAKPTQRGTRLKRVFLLTICTKTRDFLWLSVVGPDRQIYSRKLLSVHGELEEVPFPCVSN